MFGGCSRTYRDCARLFFRHDIKIIYSYLRVRVAACVCVCVIIYMGCVMYFCVFLFVCCVRNYYLCG